MNTTDSVLDILIREGGYRQLPRPFKLGSISFDLTHVLVAEERANDLVIVIELRGDAFDRDVPRKVSALTRALDVMGSTRPVTAILTSVQPPTEAVQSISKVCRVLPIGAPTGLEALSAVRDWLAVLLPLIQPPAVETILDWEFDLRAATAESAKGELMDAFIGAASRNKESVELALARAITSSVDAAMMI